MTKIKIHFYEQEAKDQLAKTEATAKNLQPIHDAIISLGAVDLDIQELRNIVDSESSYQAAGSIRGAILKDKKLEISGLKIDPSTIQLPEKEISTLVLKARRLDPGRRIVWQHLAVDAGKIIVTESGKQTIVESFTVYGSDKAAKVIKAVEKLCNHINPICEQVGADTFSPLRSVESWLTWNVVEKKYEVDFLKLVNHIK